MHESTKHTPYELVFGQPPRSVLIPDVTFKGMINEEDMDGNVDGTLKPVAKQLRYVLQMKMMYMLRNLLAVRSY